MKKSIISGIVILVVLVSALVIYFSFSKTLYIENLKYSDIESVKLLLDKKYKEFKINKFNSFTYLEEVDSYIKLWSTNNFDLNYLAGKNIILEEGVYPSKDNEVLIPIEMKKGLSSSEVLNNKGYNLGDTISLNVRDYYYTENLSNASLETQEVKAKFEIKYCTNFVTNVHIKDEAVMKDFKVVGFYKFKGMDSLVKLTNINVITFEEFSNIENDARVEVIFTEKRNGSLKKAYSTDIHKNINYYDESGYVSIKTCNDTLNVLYN